MSAEEEKPDQENPEEKTNELREPLWAVIAFDGPVAKGLTYDEAVEKIKGIPEEEKSGLCVVTNEAADRMRRPTDAE